MTDSTARTTPGRSGPALAALVATLAVGWWLLSLGHGALASPSLAHPATWPDWIERVGAVDAAFATMRVLCLVAVPYVALCLLLGLLAGRLRHEGLRRLARRLCLAPLRPLLDALVGVTLGVGTLSVTAMAVAVPTAGALGTTPVVAPTMRAVPSPGRAANAPPTMTMVGVPSVGGPRQGRMTMRATSSPTPGAATPDAATPDAATPDAVTPDAVSPDAVTSSLPVADESTAPATATSVVVGRGDSFWHIAETALATASGRAPSEAEVAPYWQRLVDLNRSELADPANPDLLFVGQTLRLPPPG